MHGSGPLQVAVISDDEAFHRDVGRVLRDSAGFSLVGRIRSASEIRRSNGADVVILGPLAAWATAVSVPNGVIGVVTVGDRPLRLIALPPAVSVASLGDGWTPARLAAAVTAVAAGLDASDHGMAAPDRWEVPPGSGSLQVAARGAENDWSLTVSPREHEIIEAVAAGFTNGEIAAARGLSVNTVKFHLQSVFEKLDVHSRSQLVAEALRRGLITL
jgi:DNA-binding NarL/FixJ family response regulator